MMERINEWSQEMENFQAALRGHLRLVITNLKVKPGQHGYPLTSTMFSKYRAHEQLDLTREKTKRLRM